MAASSRRTGLSGSRKPPWVRSDGFDEISSDLPTWREIRLEPPLVDVKYHTATEGIARITINRPEIHNAFRPRTVFEMSRALTLAQDDTDIGVIIMTGEVGVLRSPVFAHNHKHGSLSLTHTGHILRTPAGTELVLLRGRPERALSGCLERAAACTQPWRV